MCTPQYSLNDIYRRMITIIGEYLQVMGFLDLKLEGKQFDRVNMSYFFFLPWHFFITCKCTYLNNININIPVCWIFDFFHSNIPGMLCIPLTRFQMNKLDFFLSKACGSIDIVLSFKILIFWKYVYGEFYHFL